MKKVVKKKSALRETVEFLIWLAFILLLSFLIIKFVCVRSIVDGSSMFPTLSDGDNLIVEKVTYYRRDPARYDIVVFELRDEPGVHYIKRVMGLPGETVTISEGCVFINGEKLEDDLYGAAPIIPDLRFESCTLGEGEYFCMGDNRNHSNDSREIGPSRKEQIIGRAWFRFWPFKKAGLLTKKDGEE